MTPLDLLIRYRRLTPERRVVLWEAAWRLALAQGLVHILPFRWLAGSLGRKPALSPGVTSPDEISRARLVAWAMRVIVRRLPRSPKCLVQAVAAQWMLRRRKLTSTLYLGVARDPSRSLSAHAWVCCGELFITGGADHQYFTVVAQFPGGNTP